MCAHVPASMGRQWKDGWSSFLGPCSGQAVLVTQRSRDGWSRSALPALLAIHRPPTAAWEAITPLNMCCSKLVFLVRIAVAEVRTPMVLPRSVHLHVEITSWVTYALKVSWTNWTQYCPGYNLCCRPLRDVVPAQTGKLMLSSCGRSCHVNLFMSTSRGKVLSCPSRLGCAVGTGSVGEETCPSPCACSQQVGWRGSLASVVCIYTYTRACGCHMHLRAAYGPQRQPSCALVPLGCHFWADLGEVPVCSLVHVETEFRITYSDNQSLFLNWMNIDWATHVTHLPVLTK